ncbi:uncharacterized protein LOC129946100 [Eupeodes corollae]|uniref:uncharacterized protein LOC129946100 n=1 Tax=Eupeodes corollae TaxID=290404 RepID=UPI0024919281|nr:uncharacterized protein LOC129946100 [Eupeodes corollae]
MASVVFLAFISSLFLLIIINTSVQFNSVEGLPLSQGKRNIVYTRYVRRRPIPYSNNYVREVIEVFKTHRRPPPYAFLHDEDLTRFVRCDFDPSMPDCGEETNSATTSERSSTSSTTSRSDISTSTLAPFATSTRTTFTPLSWWDRRTEESSTETPTTSTTTTEQNIPQLGLPEAITSTSKPLVSIDLEDEETNKSEDGNEYDDGFNKERNNDPGETEYYDEGEEDENNNSQGVTNDNEVEEEAEAEVETADDADTEVETQTQETTVKPTTKSFLNWF